LSAVVFATALIFFAGDMIMAGSTTLEIAYGDYEHELKQTRRVLEAVPSDRLDFKPHEKSYTLGGLAQHIAQLPMLFASIASQSELDFAKVPKLGAPTNTAEIVALFDESAQLARGALAQLSEQTLSQSWSLRFGDQVFYTGARGPSLRNLGMSHMIHHRAQLTVYLRLLNIKVPGLYGPSADEM
jgi:uncharacterized damage-inducible protein DinB